MAGNRIVAMPGSANVVSPAAGLYADSAAPYLPSSACSVMMVGSDEKAQVPIPTTIAAMTIISAFAPNHCGM